jgi:hypothetical protein
LADVNEELERRRVHAIVSNGVQQDAESAFALAVNRRDVLGQYLICYCRTPDVEAHGGTTGQQFAKLGSLQTLRPSWWTANSGAERILAAMFGLASRLLISTVPSTVKPLSSKSGLIARGFNVAGFCGRLQGLVQIEFCKRGRLRPKAVPALRLRLE